MTFEYDSLFEEVKGRYYIDSLEDDQIIYRVDSITPLLEGVGLDHEFNEMVVKGPYFDFEGNKQGEMAKEFFSCLKDPKAPIGWKPRQEELEKLAELDSDTVQTDISAA